MDNGKRWWFSLKTHQVEDDDGPTPGKDRLGPFATEQEAAHALDKVRQRCFDALVPGDLNQAAMREMETGIRGAPAGTPLAQAYPATSTIGRILDLPEIQGIITSLVGPGPLFDHHAIHVRQAEEEKAQALHSETALACQIAVSREGPLNPTVVNRPSEINMRLLSLNRGAIRRALSSCRGFW